MSPFFVRRFDRLLTCKWHILIWYFTYLACCCEDELLVLEDEDGTEGMTLVFEWWWDDEWWWEWLPWPLWDPWWDPDPPPAPPPGSGSPRLLATDSLVRRSMPDCWLVEEESSFILAVPLTTSASWEPQAWEPELPPPPPPPPPPEPASETPSAGLLAAGAPLPKAGKSLPVWKDFVRKDKLCQK